MNFPFPPPLKCIPLSNSIFIVAAGSSHKTSTPPVSSRHVSPEVAQKNLEEHFRNVRQRVSKEERRGDRKEWRVSPDDLQLLADERRDSRLWNTTQPSKRKRGNKARRWFKKFSSNSVDYPSAPRVRDSPELLQGGTDRKKTKTKKWSFKSKEAQRREMEAMERHRSLVACPSKVAALDDKADNGASGL